MSLREKGAALAASNAGSWWFLNVANRIDRVLLPATRGRVSSAPGRNILLLDTTGAKSGERRRTPLQFVRDGDHVVLIASRGGDVKHPAWFHNLKKEPRVHLIGPRITGDWRARVAQGDERERLWRLAAQYYPGYDTYRDRAGGREIPVVVLERAAGTAA
ncbi:MAG TPA: nitroreductase/quinone reductase family protein [Thermoleophilaceae bacterium]|jgi:deazaflavin-dependent oxidoreductase (nitroreductase family)|nr:nitroreductase/quinone reductase family protein [Thermoleophilaceae bacterium]